MPVVGTPIAPIEAPPPTVETPAEQTCDDQNKISPTVSRYYEELVLSRMRSVRGRTGQQMEITWTMTDSHGHAVDLTECGFADVVAESSSSSVSSWSSSSESSAAAAGPSFKFRIRENLSLGFTPRPPQTQYEVELVEAATGQVKIILPPAATAIPGVYFGEIASFDENDICLFTNVFYVIIERGQFGKASHIGGPPTIQEIRLHLRDSSPAESRLLDNIKFDDAEIALAISRPLEYWNEMPPPLGVRVTTQNFPFRYHWMEAICANLFWMVEEQFRANNLTYSAAGVQVNDQDKEPNYARAAERRNANWVDFVKRKKASINLENAYGGIGSSYRYAGGSISRRGY